jgi:hypothetical protein
MPNVADLEFEDQSVEGFFNELEDDVKALIVEDGVYQLVKTKEDPALFTDAIKVTEVPDGLYIQDGRVYFNQDDVDYLFVKFTTGQEEPTE